MFAYMVAGVAGSAWVAALVVVTRAFLVRMTPPTAGGQGLDAEWAARIVALETQVAGLPSLWEEERSRAERAQERARAALRRAEKLREEFEDEPDADIDVHGLDARGGGEQGVLPLHPDVGRALSPHERAAAQGLTPFALAGM